MANIKAKVTVVVEGKEVQVQMENSATFCKRKGIKPQALYYARKNGLVDVWKEGRTVLVLLTKKSLAYQPNAHPASARAKKEK